MFAAASRASQRQPDNANEVRFNHSAFERADDDPNLEGALTMYRSYRFECLAHMSQTLDPLEGFDWNLRNYPPFLEAFPQDAEALNKRWASVTALMSKEQLAALEDRSILTIADWDVLKQKPTGTDEERTKLHTIYAKILNNPKRNDVQRVLRRVEGGERYRKAYTREVHAQLKALIGPLTTLVRDEITFTPETRPNVTHIGWELHKLGGFRAQTAVAIAMAYLLNSQVPEGGVCVESHLNYEWNRCGDWLA